MQYYEKKIIFLKKYSFDYKDIHYNRIRLYSFFNYNYADFYEINYHEKKIYRTNAYGLICGNNNGYELTSILLKDDNFLKYFFRIINHIFIDNENEYNFFSLIKDWQQVKKWLFYYEKRK